MRRVLFVFSSMMCIGAPADVANAGTVQIEILSQSVTATAVFYDESQHAAYNLYGTGPSTVSLAHPLRGTTIASASIDVSDSTAYLEAWHAWGGIFILGEWYARSELTFKALEASYMVLDNIAVWSDCPEAHYSLELTDLTTGDRLFRVSGSVGMLTLEQAFPGSLSDGHHFVEMDWRWNGSTQEFEYYGDRADTLSSGFIPVHYENTYQISLEAIPCLMGCPSVISANMRLLPVPEPNTMLLCGFGLGIVGFGCKFYGK